MRMDSFVVAEMLQRWEQQGAALRPSAVEITAALNKDSRSGFPMALDASAELHRMLEAFVATSDLLEDHVVKHDGMGALGESLDELALRARAMVIVAQVDQLGAAFAEPTVAARAHGWFAGKLQRIADLVALVRDEMSRVHAMWLPYRQGQPRHPGTTEADRATLYCTKLRIAHRALRELWDDPDLARFLECGVAATDLREVNLSCKQIVSVLGLPIKPRRARAICGATEAR